MFKRSRASRFAITVRPGVLQALAASRGAWYETPEEVEAGLEWGKRKAELLAWVRRQMDSRLTLRERRCIELYFFEGLSYREAGKAADLNASTVLRSVRRALRKLRLAAETEHLPRRPRG